MLFVTKEEDIHEKVKGGGCVLRFKWTSFAGLKGHHRSLAPVLRSRSP